MNDRAVTLVSVVSLGPGDQSVEFHLGHGDMIRLLRGCGFEIEDLHETRRARGYHPVSVRDARMGPAMAREEV
jgi:hypothetical protein